MHEPSVEEVDVRVMYGSNAGVIGKHQTAHAVVRLHIRRSTRERDLNRGRAPRYEVRELPLSDTEQGLMYLWRRCQRLMSVPTVDKDVRLLGRRRPE